VSRPPERTDITSRPAILVSRRDVLRAGAAAAAGFLVPGALGACVRPGPDQSRLTAWTADVRSQGLARAGAPTGRAATRVGELAGGTPYVPGTLDAYLRGGTRPAATEPLTLSLTHFDCVTLVESCLAVARLARDASAPTWEHFGAAIERMRYRGGRRRGYGSRLHYFSEWITDGERRGLVRSLGGELGGVADERPLRFMTTHRASYPALADDAVFDEIVAIERGLDAHPRRVIPTKRIPQIVDRLETGDVIAFATEIPGLDVTHSAFAYRDPAGTLRVLHAPLSGGSVEITRTTLPEYVAAIRRATGILVARPLWA
jgi:hypothetical protein